MDGEDHALPCGECHAAGPRADLSYTLGVAAVSCEQRADGSLVLQNRESLAPYPTSIAASLSLWAQRAPQRLALADRKVDPREWRSITYGGALASVEMAGGVFVEFRPWARLATIMQALRPGLIIVDQPQRHLDAFGRQDWPEVKIVGMEPHAETIAFDSLLSAAPSHALESVEGLISADTVAKILFTSGSTERRRAH